LDNFNPVHRTQISVAPKRQKLSRRGERQALWRHQNHGAFDTRAVMHGRYFPPQLSISASVVTALNQHNNIVITVRLQPQSRNIAGLEGSTCSAALDICGQILRPLCRIRSWRGP
jgi:hypothetical protein